MHLQSIRDENEAKQQQQKTRSDDANHNVVRLLFVFLFTICIYDIRQTNEFFLHSPLPDQERTERQVKTKLRG